MTTMQHSPQPERVQKDQRWLRLPMISLGILLALGNLAFYPAGEGLGKGGVIFTAVWFGVLVGQAGLGAIWLGLGNAKELFRLATAGGAYLAAVAMWLAGLLGWQLADDFDSSKWAELAVPLLVLPLCIMSAAVPLWLLRLFAGWCIHHEGSPPNPLSIRQFSISNLMLLTTLVALLLGLGQQVARLEAKEPLEFWMSMGGVFLAAMIASAATLVPAVAALTRFPALSGIVVVVLGIVYFVVASLFAALLAAIGKRTLPTDELAGIYGMTSCPFIGFLSTLFLPLLVLRWRGYRLVVRSPDKRGVDGN